MKNVNDRVGLYAGSWTSSPSKERYFSSHAHAGRFTQIISRQFGKPFVAPLGEEFLMKCFWKITCLSALFTAAWATTAVVQDSALLQPSNAVHVNVSTNLIQDAVDPSQSDGSVEQDMADAMAVQEAPAEEAECEEECPVRLFPETCHGIQIGGWFSGGVYQNGQGVSSGTGNAPVLFPQVSDGATLDQAWIYAEKALPDDCCCYDWGFRIDYVFGTDGPDTQAFGDIGWDNDWDSSRDYGSAIPPL